MRRAAAIALVALIALPGVISTGGSSGRAVAGSDPSSLHALSHVSVIVTVSARLPWQSTNVIVKQGETVTVQVVAGEWTASAGHSPYQSGEGENNAAPDDFLMPGYPAGGLIGQINYDDQLFFVGHEHTFTAHDSGTLYLCMNDASDGLYDNDGTLTVRVTVSSAAPLPVKGVAPLYPTGDAGIPPNVPVRFAWQRFPGATNYAFHVWMIKQNGAVAIKPTTMVMYSTLVFHKTSYTWNDQGFLPGAYQYSLLPLDAQGNALAPWSTPVPINIYSS